MGDLDEVVQDFRVQRYNVESLLSLIARKIKSNGTGFAWSKSSVMNMH